MKFVVKIAHCIGKWWWREKPCSKTDCFGTHKLL